ncbi:hypothetical protein L873DRAFT_1787609 [Choiromyces venosus 120613-1]|uniref:Uncharacterized protein n=1 Tax=Choiromyces venosus 120613-1 TaxID=1336337 RepID=A0A3N4JZD5_9PEZI|nr:hypothetical protein L873DRAFT_1787609 [Choiromyces venosus 120613-1]
MSAQTYEVEDIRLRIPETDDERIHRTELDAYIERVLGHHGAEEVTPERYVPNMQNISEQSFLYRDCWIPKNIQFPQCDNGTPNGNQSKHWRGEVPVTFYDYILDSGEFKYVVMPLQYLYKGYGAEMDPEKFPFPNPPSGALQDATSEPPLEQHLRIVMIKGISNMPLCEAFSSERIWKLEKRGDSLRPGVSFQLVMDSKHFTVAMSIPYLGVEKDIGPPTLNGPPISAEIIGGLDTTIDQQNILNSLEELTDYRKGSPTSRPRESSILNQETYPKGDSHPLRDGDTQGEGVSEDFILVHHAGIILLDTSSRDHGSNKERLAIFRSCDDKKSGRLPLLPHQKSTNPLDAFLNVLSNTLKSSERDVLDNLRHKMSNYSLDFQKFAKGTDAFKELDRKLISNSATLPGELLAVIGVVKSQKRHIKDLQEFIIRLNAEAKDTNHPNGTLRLSGKWKEEKSPLVEKICFILKERQSFLDEVNEIFLEVKEIGKSVADTLSHLIIHTRPLY